MATYVVSRLIVLGSAVVLARLLSPEVFGLMVLAQAVVLGIAMFSEIGVGTSLIQNERTDTVFINTAWTLQVLRGLVIAGGAAVLAYPAALYYDDTRFLWIIPIIAVNSVIAGCNSTSMFSMSRELREGRRSFIDLCNIIVTRMSMLIFAFVSPTIWAILVGTFLGTIATLILSHALNPGPRNRFQYDRDSASAIIRFGKWIFVGTIIAFFAQQIDKLLLGRVETIAAVGVYGIALTFARLPQEAIAMLSNHVLFPVYAHAARSDRATLRAKVLHARSILLAAALVGVVGVTLFSPLFFGALYDQRYREAVWIAPLTLAASWFEILDHTASKALLSLGETKVMAYASALKVLVGGGAALLGFWAEGLIGFIIGLSIGSATAYVIIAAKLRSQRLSMIRQDLLYSVAVILCVIVVVAFPGYEVTERRVAISNWPFLIIQFGAAGLTLLAFACMVVTVVRPGSSVAVALVRVLERLRQ